MSQGHDEPEPGTAEGLPGATRDVSAPADFTSRARCPFSIVGIGASAGGIDALKVFFGATAPDSGMAYVVIQHLSPEHQSLMAEILGRCTSMPVSQIQDGMSVQPNHVYVIRPSYTVTLKDGRLRLGEPVERRGHRRPVDDFFRSLAEEQQEKAVAIVLSGTGTNGSAGAQAIKAAGGLCIAQDPNSAEFPGMPQSLIYAGYADQVLRADEIPAVLLRRIDRRMGLLGITTLADYANRLRERTEEVAALANDLMINVTGFFRDPEAWEAFREAVVEPLVAERAANEVSGRWRALSSTAKRSWIQSSNSLGPMATGLLCR